MTTNRRQTSAAGLNAKISASLLFLAICLGILALRVTYTESPTAQSTTAMDGSTDTVYSLTVSGLLIFAPLAWLLWQMAGGTLRYRFTGIEIGLVVFLVACVVSGAGASNKRLAITQTAILIAPIFSAILLVQLLDSLGKVRLLLIVIAALAVVSAYQCAEQFFVSNELTIEQYENAPESMLEPLGITPGSFQQFLFEHRIYSRGVRGFFTTSNSAGSFVLMATLAALALLLEQIRLDKTTKTRSRDTLFRSVAAAVVLIGLLLTRSKGGILGLAFGGLSFLVLLRASRWLRVHRRLVWSLLLPTAIVVAGLATWAAVSYGTRHGRLPGGNSMLVRWQYWSASARMVGDHPLDGVGPGNFAQYYTQYKPPAAPESVADPHCFPLSLLAQFGPLGLLGFLLMVFGAIYQTIRVHPDRIAPAVSDAQSSGKQTALFVLGIICVIQFVVRPLLMPMSTDGDAVVAIYQLVSLYVAPAAAFLIGFFLLTGSMRSLSAEPETSSSRLFAAALGCATLGVLVHNLIDFAVFEPGVWTTFWFVVAGVVASRAIERPLSFERTVTSKSTLIVAGVAVALLGVYWQLVWLPAYQVATGVQAARTALVAGRFDDAHRFLDMAASADPLDPSPPNLDGQVYAQQAAMLSPDSPQQLQEAARQFQAAIEINPAGYKSYERLGSILATLGQYEDASQAYSNAIDRYPGLGRLWLEKARVAERLGKTEAALADYGRAVEIEDAFRAQFRQMYPQHAPVSRLGDEDYRLAKERIAALSQ